MSDGTARRGPIDPGLQAERTSLAWERTAIAAMVAGVLLARYEADDIPLAAVVGFAGVLGGAVLLVWSAVQPDDPRPSGPAGTAARIGVIRAVGVATVAFLFLALVFAVATALGA